MVLLKKILIVDDNIEYLSLLADCLNKDFETYKASGVKSALCVLENTSIDLVCSDYFMGDGTGLDLLEELRKNNVDNNIPFVIMSGSEDARIVSMSTKRGAIFCSKTHPDLLSVIKRAANIEDQKE